MFLKYDLRSDPEMIKNRNDYLLYIREDAIASGRDSTRVKFWGDEIWMYQRLLRLTEYHENCYFGAKRLVMKPIIIATKYVKYKLGLKLGFSISRNIFDYGLSIAHVGTIICNGNSKVGKYCRIQTGVTLGATNGGMEAPEIGDYCFLGDGCKIIGNVKIGDSIAIGANAVVVSDILENGTTWGGIPAKKISDNDSHNNLNNKIFSKDPIGGEKN